MTDRKMTIKELYDFAVENHCEDYTIIIKDDYSGFNPVADLTICNNDKELILWVD